MIVLHRLGNAAAGSFLLNPDLLVTVERTPDTVVALSTGARLVVDESPEQVQAAVREYRVGILAEALGAGGSP